MKKAIMKYAGRLKRSKQLRSTMAMLLSLLLFFEGLPFLPSTWLPKALAGTGLGVSPSQVESLYGGKMDVTWEYNDPGTGQKSHPTDIDIAGTQVVSGQSYPVSTENKYTWDGQINGQPLKDGAYTVQVKPTDFPAFSGSSTFTVFNPAPPAPADLQILPDLHPPSANQQDAYGNNLDTFTVRGIAEVNTKVTLYVWYTVRQGDNRKVEIQTPTTLSSNNSVTPGQTWSSGYSISNYFPQFPAYTSKTPADFVGEWQAQVQLPEYEIAHITAVTTRDFDGKSSGSSKELDVLNYKASSWDVKWAYLAGYYYDATTTEAMGLHIADVATFNGYPLSKCSDGQTCPGFIDYGVNLLLMKPLEAGNINQDDEKLIEEGYELKYGHPIPTHLDPIDLATGGFSFTHTNISLQGPLPIDFTATYHTGDLYDGMLGVGWHTSLEWHLFPWQNGNVVVVTPTGANLVYAPSSGGGGQYVAPNGVFDMLTKQSDGTYVLVTPQKKQYVFRQDGLLWKIVDSNGNTALFTYAGTILQSVSTNSGTLNYTYGPGGKLMQLVDQAGRSVQYQYDANNDNLISITLPDGAAIQFTYDANHRITQIQNPNGTGTLVNQYDDQGRVVKQQDFSGNWSSISYASADRVTTTTDARGNQTVFHYDERNRRTEVDYPDGTSEKFTYDVNDDMTSHTDRNGNTTTYTYDELGNLLQAVDPTGAVTSIQYNNFNKPNQITDALGNKTTLDYDDSGNVTSITNALGETTTIQYNSQGVPTSITNPLGQTVSIVNDNQGFAKLVTDPSGYVQQFERDALHRVTGITDALGNHSSMQYDPRDRIIAEIDKLGQQQTFTYDKDSNLSTSTDASGATTVLGYDSFDRMASVKDALGHTTSYAYDAVGNRIKSVDANGAETDYTYNNANRMTQAKDPLGNITSYSYDGNGNLVSIVDSLGAATTIAYDARNLPIKVTDATGAAATYAYDALGHMTRKTTALGQTTGYQYDALGRVVQVTDALQQVTAYSYDKAGRITSVTKPNGGVWQMQYDARGLLMGTVDPLGHQKSWTRDALGRVATAVDEAGNQTEHTYDAMGRVLKIVNPLGNATNFTYDPLGRIKQVTDANGHTTSYDYDKIGELTDVVNALNHETSYTYDAVGNLVSKADANGHSTQYQYDLKRELTKETDPLGRVTQYLNDSVGNMTSVIRPDGTTTGYTYDLLKRLTGIQYADGNKVSYSYDAAGRRTSMADSLGTTSYQYDALNRLIQVTNPSQKTIQYQWTPTGQKKKMVYPDGTSVSYDVDLMDHITGVTDTMGGHTSYAYDPRGLMLSKTLPQGAVSSYQYDALGQVTQIQHANQAGKLLEQLNYAYDPVGNVSQMVRNQESDDEDSSAGGDDSDDSVTSQYTYDALNQLAQVQKQNSADAASSIVTTYAYDNVGNRLSKTSVWGSTTSTEQYSFNAGNQLTHWQSGSEYKDYAYDLRGNLLTVTGDLYDDSSDTGTSAGVVPSVYESSVSQSAYSTTTTVSQSTYTDSADDESSDSGSGILGQYTWNDADQLVKQINERGDMSQYTYDGDGNRMSMTLAIAEGPPSGIGGKGNGKGQGHSNNSGVNPCGHVVPPGFVPPGLAKKCGSSADDPNSYPAGHPVSQRDGWEFEYKKQNWTFNYTNDISSGIAKPIMATDTDPTKWTERYAYGAYDERLSMTYLPANNANDGWEPTPGAWGAQPGTTPKTLYYMNDAEGSALGLMATDGRVSARYHYDEFGTPLDAKKFDPNWSGPDNLFGYTGLGEEYDSGLTFANARYYDPTVGRFISEDSYKGSLWSPQSQDRFAYVQNNPMLYTDPTGHKISGTLGMGFASSADVVKYMIEEARIGGIDSQVYWDARSFLGSQTLWFFPNAMNDDNNYFKYLFNMATQTSNNPDDNTDGKAYWAENRVASMFAAERSWQIKDTLDSLAFATMQPELKWFELAAPAAEKSIAGSLEIIEGGEYSASEINAAKYMAEQGNKVTLRPPSGTRAGGGTSDLVVNGVNYDVYTPTTSNVNRIISSMAGKNSQTTGIVLDLSQTTVTADQLGNALARVRGIIEAGGKTANITDIVIMPK